MENYFEKTLLSLLSQPIRIDHMERGNCTIFTLNQKFSKRLIFVNRGTGLTFPAFEAFATDEQQTVKLVPQQQFFFEPHGGIIYAFESKGVEKALSSAVRDQIMFSGELRYTDVSV